MVTRYGMQESLYGPYIQYRDYAELERKLVELQEAVRRLRTLEKAAQTNGSCGGGGGAVSHHEIVAARADVDALIGGE